MFFQKIQQKKALCKLISATFLVNSIGIPTTALAADVSAAGGSSSSSDGDAYTNTRVTDSNGKPTIKGTDENRDYPSWYYHDDGTPLSDAELIARNYKESYTSDEVASMYELLNTYGLDKVQKMHFNVSFRKNADGTTTIDVNDKDNNNPTKGAEPGTDKDGNMPKPQINPSTDIPKTTETTPKTTPTCDANSELVGGVCMVKCAAGSTRDSKDKLCHVTSCPAGSIYNEDKTACTVCPTGTEPNAAQTECVKKPATCQTNQIYADNDKTSCKTCPTGTTPNADQTECVTTTCPANQIYADSTKSSCKECPDGQVPNADQTACVAKAKPAPRPPAVCKTNQIKNASGTCETCPTGKQPNKAGTACEYTQTCPTGQTIKKDSDGKDVVDEKGNPVCEATKTDTCDTTKGKELWTDKSGKQNCVDTCTSTQKRDESTGACVEIKNDTCTISQIKKSDGTCEDCPDGQVPNADQTACVAKESTSSSGGHSNSLAKAAGIGAGIYALSRLFGGSGTSTTTKTEKGTAEHVDKNAGSAIVKAEDTKIQWYSGAAEQENSLTPVNGLLADTAPYSAAISLGKVQNSLYGEPYKYEISISGTGISNVTFTPGKAFTLIKEGQALKAGTYTGYINLFFDISAATDKAPKGKVETIKVQIQVSESQTVLDESLKENKISISPSIVDEEDLKQNTVGLTGAKVLAAVWKDGSDGIGYCELQVSNGTVVGTSDLNNSSMSLNQDTRIASRHLTKEQCNTDSLKGQDAAFTKLYLDKTINSSGILVDYGETTIGNTAYYNEDSMNAMYERLGIGKDDSRYRWIMLDTTPVLTDRETGEVLDYAGNKLNTPDQQAILAKGLGLSELSGKLIIKGDAKTGYHYYNGDTGEEIKVGKIDDTNLQKSLAHTAPGVSKIGQFTAPSEYLADLLKQKTPITNNSVNLASFIGTNANADEDKKDKNGNSTGRIYWKDQGTSGFAQYPRAVVEQAKSALKDMKDASSNAGIAAQEGTSSGTTHSDSSGESYSSGTNSTADSVAENSSNSTAINNTSNGNTKTNNEVDGNR